MMKALKLFLWFVMVQASVYAGPGQEPLFRLGNGKLTRLIAVEEGRVRTQAIRNEILGRELNLKSQAEFRFRISEEPRWIYSESFSLSQVVEHSDSSLVFELSDEENSIKVRLHYKLGRDALHTTKFLEIMPQRSITIERIDLEVMDGDVRQPYQLRMITAQGPAQWKPGLGQPLYGRSEPFFLGTEFPASYNYVEEGEAVCGYLWGRKLRGGGKYVTYRSVIGLGQQMKSLESDFLSYIDKIRIRPLRLQVQYNSWFDFGGSVDQEKFEASVAKVHQELVLKRGVPPLRAYVIDDGWQDVHADWSNKVWKVNGKFDPDFAGSFRAVKKAGSKLGLWLSPGCLFGAQPAAKKLGDQGFELLGNWMSMAGPRYMQLLEERMLELTRDGVSYFKLDGLFGHLNTREFELRGQRYGIPYLPQLVTEGFEASDPRLNHPRYDELKTYYLVAGTERLMEIFKKQHAINPEVYIVISNGAFLSPWWLMYVDAVWMINAGDAAEGSTRSEELVYRDGIYYEIWKEEHTQFPMHSVFNHEPKKTETGESRESFASYLLMNLSRATGFVELYIKTGSLSDSDWDVLADGLKWCHRNFSRFKSSAMHGGDPRKGEVYGYTARDGEGGYLSAHNPANADQTYRIRVDEAIGIFPGQSIGEFKSAFRSPRQFPEGAFSYGDEVMLRLKPGEVELLEFRIGP